MHGESKNQLQLSEQLSAPVASVSLFSLPQKVKSVHPDIVFSVGEMFVHHAGDLPKRFVTYPSISQQASGVFLTDIRLLVLAELVTFVLVGFLAQTQLVSIVYKFSSAEGRLGRPFQKLNVSLLCPKSLLMCVCDHCSARTHGYVQAST